MNPQWEPVTSDPDAKRVWRKVLRPIAKQLRNHAEAMADQIIERLEEKQSMTIDDLGVEIQPGSVNAIVRQLADMLDTGAEPRELELPPPVVADVQLRARQNVPLAALMRSYRLAQDTLWGWLFEQIMAKTTEADQALTLQLTTDWLFAYIDYASLAVEQVYEQERDSWIRSNAAARTGAIDDILAERERDPQKASKRLRYDINREHVAVIFWADAAPEAGDGALQQELAAGSAELAKAVSAQTTLTRLSGSRALEAWLSWPRQSGAHKWKLPQIARRLHIPAGIRIAIGEPGWGISGFCGSHLEAAHTRRVAELTGSRADTLTRFRDVAVAALASMDPHLSSCFVTRVLGPLADDDETTYRLAMTLAVYLQENRSPTRSAKRLTVHPNTVTYRINQAENILGRSVDSDTVDVSMALALLPLLAGMTDQL